MLLLLFLLLLFIIILVRRRFTNNTPVFVFLRKPYVSFFLVIIPSCVLVSLFAITHSDYILNNTFFTVFLGIVFGFFISVSSMLMIKGPIRGTFFVMPFRTLTIHIAKDFIPDIKTKKEYNNFIIHFVNEINSIDKKHTRTIVIKSHLLTKRIRGMMVKELQSLGIKSSHSDATTSATEKILLNFFYGNKTIKNLTSTNKHENGFKVHNVGGVIKMHIE